MDIADENLSFQQLSVLDLLKSHIQSQRDAIASLEEGAVVLDEGHWAY